jgi:hypothetical protein
MITSDLYATQYLMIFSEICRFIVVPVIALPPPFLPIGKLVLNNVGLTRQPRSGGIALHGMRVTSPTRVGSETIKHVS